MITFITIWISLGIIATIIYNKYFKEIYYRKISEYAPVLITCGLFSIITVLAALIFRKFEK